MKKIELIKDFSARLSQLIFFGRKMLIDGFRVPFEFENSSPNFSKKASKKPY